MQYLTSGIHLALEFMYGLTGSYGSAIFLLTLTLRLALMPLMLRGQRAGRKTAALQAEAQAIQSTYQGEEAQRRLRELYTRSGSSLLTGCLPTLAQWPVLLAMYGALTSFPFAIPAGFLWLTNLGAPDPYFVLPGLVLATQLWQSVATLPKEQRLLAFILPLVMGFFLVKTSAAVALYWLTSNLISLGQHYLFTRREATAAA